MQSFSGVHFSSAKMTPKGRRRRRYQRWIFLFVSIGLRRKSTALVFWFAGFGLFCCLRFPPASHPEDEKTHTRDAKSTFMSSLCLRSSHKPQCSSDVLTLCFTSNHTLDFKSTLCEIFMHKWVLKKDDFIIWLQINDIFSMITFRKILIIRLSAVLPVIDALQDVFLSSDLIPTYQTDKWFPLKLHITQKTPDHDSRSASTGAFPSPTPTPDTSNDQV